MSYNKERRQTLAMGLKAARHKSGMSASRAAALITLKGLACTRGTLLAWERGVGCTSREPFASDLSVLAAIYGCKIAEFFHLELPVASDEPAGGLQLEPVCEVEENVHPESMVAVQRSAAR